MPGVMINQALYDRVSKDLPRLERVCWEYRQSEPCLVCGVVGLHEVMSDD